jgi:hypothetical protein
MEGLPHIPKSLPIFRRSSPISPSSTRMLRQIVDTRDTSKIINLSATVRNIKPLPQSEMFELSFQLSTLRKTIDKYSVLNIQKESKIENLKLRLKQLNESCTSKKEDLQKASFHKHLKQQIKEAEERESEELSTQMMLESMHDRMMSTKEFLEKKEVKLKRSLEKITRELETRLKQRKDTIDSAIQFKSVYNEALSQFLYEKNSLNEEKSRLENHSNEKRKLLRATEEHNKNRLEIIELTMIEERSAHLDKLRNSLLIHKCFEYFLNKKIISEKKTFEKLDIAFQKIKLKTGLQTIEDVIERFLTKETSLKELTENIHQKEESCNSFQQKISDMQKKFNLLSSEKKDAEESQEFKEFLQKHEKSEVKLKELKNIFMSIQNWLDLLAVKLIGSCNPEYKKMSLKEKLVTLKEFVLKTVKEYSSSGNLHENERKRRKIKIEEIINRIKHKLK